MDQPKISIIVPVYKVEPYLRKCLDSIMAQAYTNIEIILVDDGSPDNCGAICDEYATKDSRIIVIHKENGGVSSARNAGLGVATGEWIGWVDPDDWVDLNMFECMVKHAVANGAEIAVCSRFEEYSRYNVYRGWEEPKLLMTEEALGLLLENNQMQSLLWDKLWKRELFEGLYFWEKRTYEDIALMHRLFERAEKVICIPDGYYHYFQREGSIVGDITLKNRINHYLASQQRYSEMLDRWPQFTTQLICQCAVSAINIWGVYLKNPRRIRRQYKEQIIEISEFSKLYQMIALESAKVGRIGRLMLRLTPYPRMWSFVLASLLSAIYRRLHGKYL